MRLAAKRALILFVTTAPVILSISGCINYEQETFLNEDFSGRLEMRIYLNPKPFLEASVGKVDASPRIKNSMRESIEKAAYKLTIKEQTFLDTVNKDGIKNSSYAKTDKDGVTYFCFASQFDDIRKAYEGKRKVMITEDGDGLVTYTEYFLSSDNEGKEKQDQTDPDFYKGCRFKYVLHMPRDIVKANTDKIDKDTAVWDLPMEQAATNKDFFITATMKAENKFLRWIKRLRK